MKTAVLLITATAALVGTCLAQTSTDTPPDKTAVEAAVAANDRAYEAAYARGDVKVLANFFSDDAQYTADDGRIFNGRTEIEAAIRSAFAASKGAKLSITADTVKALAPEVVLEKGSTSVAAKSGETSGALYTAIHVKKDGKWKISQLVETPLPVVSPHERLAEIEWLIGKWEEADKTNDVTVSSEYVWARGGNFITRNVTVKRAGQTALEGWQIIGWDPNEEHIRSWTFDGEGGFSEGVWTREGDRWLVRESGVTPDGSRTTADNTFTKLGADRLAWESINRTLDGEPQPGIGRIEINRVKGN